jgi:hypothetical protein
MVETFQRKGAISNAHAGKEFERLIKDFFLKQGLVLKENVTVDVGIRGKRLHKFDLGCISKKVLVECKSHTWTEGDNIPSAKITTWNEAMFLFYVAPEDYRKIFIVLKDYNARRKETLAHYYMRTKSHLVPDDVEIWEFDLTSAKGIRLK